MFDQLDRGNIVAFGATVSNLQAKKIESHQTYDENLGLTVDRVFPFSLAQRAGLQSGDQIHELNGRFPESIHELNTFFNEIAVGQTLILRVIRDGDLVRLTTEITEIDEEAIFDHWGGGPFSKKRFGLGNVIIHDSIVQPTECGGPLLDLEGNVIGINIARSLRIASFAIPINEVESFIRQVYPTARFHYRD